MKRHQSVVAVFDDWDALEGALADLDAERIGHAGAVLHTRKGEPSISAAAWLVQEMTELRFAACDRVRCTSGKLAAQLATRSAQGAHNVADALRGRVSSEQARALQWHIERGRLVLWLQPSTQEEFETMCARLVQASPHLVGLCDVDVNS